MKDGRELGATPWRPRPEIKHVLSLSRQQRPDLGGQKGIDGRTEGSSGVPAGVRWVGRITRELFGGGRWEKLKFKFKKGIYK